MDIWKLKKSLHDIHREAGEELQMAEVKLAMHKEMLGKDEVGLRAIQS